MRFFIHRATGFSVSVDLDEDGNYVAEVLELPGCIAGGPTYSATMEELDGSIRAVLNVLEREDPERFRSLTEPITSLPLPDEEEAAQTATERLDWTAVT